MDQACAFGSRPVLMEYDCDFLSVVPITIPKPLHLCIIDLCANPPKDTTTILRALQNCYRNIDNPTTNEKRVRESLGILNLELTKKARIAMENGDYKTLGQLMNEAQTIFDDAGIPVCAEQLSVREMLLLILLSSQCYFELLF
jgi:galactokinase